MPKTFNWRFCAAAGVPLTLLTAAVAVACSDVMVTDKAVPDVVLSSPAGASASSIRARDNLHKRNPMDWVGASHNRILHALRAEIRKPGRLEVRFCDRLAEIAASPQFYPNAVGQADDNLQRQSMRERVRHENCGSKRTAAGGGTPLWVASAPISVAQETSTQAQQLLDDLDASVSAASDSYDLSVRLAPILEASFGLDTTEQALVATAVSVALHSYEYWESELPAFQQEVADEYGGCLSSAFAAGYSDDDARNYCLNGGGHMVTRPLPPSFRRSEFLLTASPSMSTCGAGHAWEGIIRTIGADWNGAKQGFWGGLVASRTIWGGFIGALGAAAIKSGIEATDVTIEILKCAYHVT